MSAVPTKQPAPEPVTPATKEPAKVVEKRDPPPPATARTTPEPTAPKTSEKSAPLTSNCNECGDDDDTRLKLKKTFTGSGGGSTSKWYLKAVTSSGGGQTLGNWGNRSTWHEVSKPGKTYTLSEFSESQGADFRLCKWVCTRPGSDRDYAEPAPNGTWTVRPPEDKSLTCTAYNQPIPKVAKLKLSKAFEPSGAGDAGDWTMSASHGNDSVAMPGNQQDAEQVQYPGKAYTLGENSPRSGAYDLVGWVCTTDGAEPGNNVAFEDHGKWKVKPEAGKTTECTATNKSHKSWLLMNKAFESGSSGHPVWWELTATFTESGSVKDTIELDGDAKAAAIVDYPGHPYALTEVSDEEQDQFDLVGWVCTADGDSKDSDNLAYQDDGTWWVKPKIGATTSCVATNREKESNLLLTKAFDPAGSGDAGAWQLEAEYDPDDASDDEIEMPGNATEPQKVEYPGKAYELSEESKTEQQKFTLTAWSCTAGDGELAYRVDDEWYVKPARGATTTCTATNQAKTRLLLTKAFHPADAGDAGAWRLVAKAEDTAEQDSISMPGDSTEPQGVALPGAKYYLSESSSTEGDDFALHSWSCKTADGAAELAEEDGDGWFVVPPAGEETTCTALNDALSGAEVTKSPVGQPQYDPATATWAQDYLIQVTASDPTRPAKFSLTDSFSPTASIDVATVTAKAYDLGADWPPSKPLPDPIQGWSLGQPIATDVLLPIGQEAHYYYVSISDIAIDAAADQFEAACLSGGGLYNKARVTSPGGARSASGCMNIPLGHVSFTKDMTEPTYLGEGAWRAVYQLTVTNSDKGVSSYRLEDDLGFPQAWVTSSMVAATSSDGQALAPNANWNGFDRTELTGDVSINPAAIHSYTITLEIQVPRGTPSTETDCGVEVGGLWNRAALTDQAGVAQGAEVCGDATTFAIGRDVWLDDNRDGVSDPDEAPVAGVVARLFTAGGAPALDAAGRPVVDQVSDSNGRFWFDQLAAGNYRIQFTSIPAGRKLTTQDAPRAGDTADSDAQPVTGLTAVIKLDSTGPGVVPISTPGTHLPTRVLYANAATPIWDAGLVATSPTDVPVLKPSDGPVLTPTDVPVVTPSEVPVLPPTDVPVLTPTTTDTIVFADRIGTGLLPDPATRPGSRALPATGALAATGGADIAASSMLAIALVLAGGLLVGSWRRQRRTASD